MRPYVTRSVKLGAVAFMSITVAACAAEKVAGPPTVTFAAVSAGGSNTCGIMTGGGAYCWGFNGAGQVGDGSTTDRLSPTRIAGGLNFAYVNAGGSHTCGVTTGGDAYCWGSTFDGELGDGTMSDTIFYRQNPVRVAGVLNFATVSAGGVYTCGLTTGGAAYCWGFNGAGNLGDGTTTDRSSPSPVAGGLSFTAVSAGFTHTCALTAGGTAYCWGFNNSGQLGNGTATDRSSPVLVSGGLIFTHVSPGANHTCGVTTGGAAYCWGRNIYSTLGDGTSTDRSSPTPVAGGFTFATISAGSAHTCGVTTGGATYCWGFNGSNGIGELGDGTAIDRPSPALVAGNLGLASVSAGGNHSCGLRADGAAFCWGNNESGGLGDRTTSSHSVPVRVVP